jgi:hypothetical protein
MDLRSPSPGAGRIEDDEAAIDFNSPIAPDIVACIVTTEFSYTGQAGQFYTTGPAADGGPPSLTPANLLDEGISVCGGDPGEPGWAGFGVLEEVSAGQYSVPAVPGKGGPDDVLTSADRLYDPARGVIEPRADTVGDLNHGLGTVLVCSFGGAPGVDCGAPPGISEFGGQPRSRPATLVPSNENDY